MSYDSENNKLIIDDASINVTFKESATRANIQSGENLSTSLGKVKKYFNDLGYGAFLDVDQTPTQNSTNLITSDSVYVNRAALVELVDGGAKNLLKITATSTTLDGVDYAPDNSGGISINGMATADSNSFVIGTFTPAVTGDYAVVFFRSNYSNDYCMQLRNGSASNAPLVASVIDTSTISLEKGTEYTIRIYVANGTVIDDVAYPMICTKAAWDISQAFVPYAPTNRELYDIIKALQNGA